MGMNELVVVARSKLGVFLLLSACASEESSGGKTRSGGPPAAREPAGSLSFPRPPPPAGAPVTQRAPRIDLPEEVPDAASAPSPAAVFWEEDFESDLATHWITSDPAWSNPFVSTELPHEGASSLKEIFTGRDSGNFMDRYHPAVEEAWTRFYYYTEGFTYDPVVTKLFYHQADLPNSGYPSFVGLNMWGGNELAIAGQKVWEACGSDGSGPVNNGDDSCNYYPNAGHVPFTDNQWFCVETHIKMNTPGTADGVLELFVNGTQTLDYRNRTFRQPQVAATGNSAAAQLNMIRIYVQSGVGTRYLDQFAVGPSRIGCL
jgi:hypothetical protein